MLVAVFGRQPRALYAFKSLNVFRTGFRLFMPHRGCMIHAEISTLGACRGKNVAAQFVLFGLLFVFFQGFTFRKKAKALTPLRPTTTVQQLVVEPRARIWYGVCLPLDGCPFGAPGTRPRPLARPIFRLLFPVGGQNRKRAKNRKARFFGKCATRRLAAPLRPGRWVCV